MELKFKTKSLSVARNVAVPLIRKRCESHEPVMPHEAAEWVERRFPALTSEDQQKLAAECRTVIVEMIDAK